MIYVIIFLIFAGIGLNVLSQKYALQNIGYKRELSKTTVEAGEEFEITTVVENAKRLPVTFLQVNEKFPAELEYSRRANIVAVTGSLYHKTTMFLMPCQRVKRTYNVALTRRGRYVFQDVQLVAGDLLGLGVVNQEVQYWQEIVVYPKTVDLDNEIVPYGDYMGNISVRRWIIDDPILTVGVSEYTGREPQKYINWPVSLRSGKLYVNKFDHTTDNTIMIILNMECQKPFWSGIETEKVEKCISIARTLMEQFEAEAIPYGFMCNIQGFQYVNGKTQIDPGCGSAHFYAILEELGRADYSVSTDFEKVLDEAIMRENSANTYIIITPRILDVYGQYMNSLNRAANKTMVIALDTNFLPNIDEAIAVFTERGEKHE
ncbi:DUF58 domain-containing protein [Clostridium thermarum]|uniref:DUF58 domain-containing protein n=1 Tax=Clostridium thermarum TaxID=1716543 RepID=UPI001123B048|nr:DUF58 domain-containing protein [Clostridium thermarum]